LRRRLCFYASDITFGEYKPFAYVGVRLKMVMEVFAGAQCQKNFSFNGYGAFRLISEPCLSGFRNLESYGAFGKIQGELLHSRPKVYL
jgi:hypothetical protein